MNGCIWSIDLYTAEIQAVTSRIVKIDIGLK